MKKDVKMDPLFTETKKYPYQVVQLKINNDWQIGIRGDGKGIGGDKPIEVGLICGKKVEQKDVEKLKEDFEQFKLWDLS